MCCRNHFHFRFTPRKVTTLCHVQLTNSNLHHQQKSVIENDFLFVNGIR